MFQKNLDDKKIDKLKKAKEEKKNDDLKKGIGFYVIYRI